MQEERRPNIGIIGHGFVGKAVEAGFRDKCLVLVNDPKYNGYQDLPIICENTTITDMVVNCPFIFVAVPTPFIEASNSVDTSVINEVIHNLYITAVHSNVDPIVIVKSAVPPSVVRSWGKYFSNLQIVVSPEYLTERTSIHDFVNQKVMILGGAPTSTLEVHELYIKHSICNKQCKVGFCTPEEAALIKYMENSFLAMKCIFNNQFKKLYDTLFPTLIPTEEGGGDFGFNNLLTNFYLDERMGVMPFDYTVPGPDGDLGYGGKCLPKDVKTIISEADKVGVSLSIMKEVDAYNEKIRTDKNWKTIPGAVV